MTYASKKRESQSWEDGMFAMEGGWRSAETPGVIRCSRVEDGIK